MYALHNPEESTKARYVRRYMVCFHLYKIQQRAKSNSSVYTLIRDIKKIQESISLKVRISEWWLILEEGRGNQKIHWGMGFCNDTNVLFLDVDGGYFIYKNLSRCVSWIRASVHIFDFLHLNIVSIFSLSWSIRNGCIFSFSFRRLSRCHNTPSIKISLSPSSLQCALLYTKSLNMQLDLIPDFLFFSLDYLLMHQHQDGLIRET